MTDKDFEEPIDEVPGDKGSEAQASDPESQGAEPAASAADGDGEPELTIEDILAAAQSADAAAADAPAQSGAEPDLLVDLKRVQAEYANYRRRTEEQREVELERARGSVARSLLPVLDDLDRAEKHGDLTEGSVLSAVADKLRGIVSKLGVERYGEAGDVFDPQQHEAIFQAPTPGTTDPTILEVVEIGYRLGTTELRPAKVVVAVPAE
ncbi:MULTISPECIES: nucleotide exchange factor GrpE [unclassified Microbacterium]|uniref:nucleotide exchange factor GrpE n=1 Tax=unclassified Microbacterium TaxID=2609290 RepID=UPI00214CD767|nr:MULTISPECIES: nucleotide exchange factor GrpE [unclassified Microbacterium]MCR2783157.1 nucleotide exchange factor GrpE [Microbacterium sp. zg.B96]MDL5352058.1 nucleotide exchange factor GrpE [Microbacterium sp. zg-YB36]WIM15963.1 nucleotide exchange factor GrpE [Microbacterium sp. zg-B96]